MLFPRANRPQLPTDLKMLQQAAGIRSFEVLAIGPSDGLPVGALLVGKKAANGFGGNGGAKCVRCLLLRS